MVPSLPSLPICDVLEQLSETMATSSRVLLQAPPGAGKTTTVPLALMNESWMENRTILMLEPRRLAARSAAARMAELLGEEIGMQVGYHVRSDKRISPDTKILVITEGILTRYLQNDPSLEGVGLIIFDEYHERHLHSDLSMAFALQTQELLRDDLKILVMSATLDTRGLISLLDNPPIITSQGRSYPVTLTYQSPSAPTIDSKTLIGEIHRTILNSVHNDEGDILVFLPGEREIRQLESRLRETDGEFLITPLYGNLTKEEQHRAILPASQRKIVLATNIAETSLTIEGVRIVIDSGLERVSRFDPSSGMERLVTQKISRVSADQRSGRAGRTSEGKAYRLWSEPAHHSLAPHRDPEILLADLIPLALELAAWGAKADELRWIDPPKPSSLLHADELLRELGAFDTAITPHGRALLTTRLHPRLAHMILRARDEGMQSEAIVLSALVSERDILQNDERHADLRERFWILKNALQSGHIPPNLSTAAQTAKEIASRFKSKWSFNTSEESCGLLLSFAYPDRIAKARGNGKFLTSGGKEAYLDPRDDLSNEGWIVIAQSDGDTTSARIRLCAPVDLETLHDHHSERFGKESSVEWNRELRKVDAKETERLGSIVLASHPLSAPDPLQVHKALLEGIRIHGFEALGWSESVRGVQKRLEALHFHRLDLCPEPYSKEALMDTLESWLLPYLGKERTLEECSALDWENLLLAPFSWEARQEFERLLPSHYTAPTGSTLAIDYSDPLSPILSIRIQEMFGVLTHPSVLEGKLSLSLHLLSPAHRPIQITRDLPGFWSGSYEDVKKELKGRYPKHYWPDDPAIAQATKKTKKFM